MYKCKRLCSTCLTNTKTPWSSNYICRMICLKGMLLNPGMLEDDPGFASSSWRRLRDEGRCRPLKLGGSGGTKEVGHK